LSNRTGAPLALRWVDFTGKSQDYGAVGPQETVTLETYPGHLWMLSNSTQVVVRYRATAAANQSLALGGSGEASTAPPPAQPQPPMTNVRPQPQPQPQQGGQTAPTGSRFTQQEAVAMVNYHNQVRAEVGVGPVNWSPQIAQFAQQWADEIAKKGKFEHRPRGQQQYGENLAAGSSPTYSPLDGAKQWYDEKKLFRAPNGVFTAALMPAGHYTQMVWRGSTEIGAGKAIIQKGQMKGWTVMVCNYNPPGNRIGAKVY
jgi:pathogenesis-related protein 1